LGKQKDMILGPFLTHHHWTAEKTNVIYY